MNIQFDNEKDRELFIVLLDNINKVEYWNFLKLDWWLLYHKVDVDKPYTYEGFSPTGEMVNVMNGFGSNHVIVMYNKGMGNKEIMRLEA